MKCAWQELLAILPSWLSQEVDWRGRESLWELRLRLGKVPELVCRGDRLWLSRTAGQEDLNFVINAASRYSPWAAQSMAYGYLTAPGGHRIGICGEAVVQQGQMVGIRRATSLNIRVARDFPGIGAGYGGLSGSILIIGPPGSGKTTLLRDIARQISCSETVAVVDERGELFPAGSFDTGKSLDILTGCPKPAAIDRVLRTMGPTTIAVDEITEQGDCEGLLRAGRCGVRLLATAHGADLDDLRRRQVYRPLVLDHLFDLVLIMGRDKSIREERL